MALLVDGDVVTLAELRVYDSSLLDVANTEQVDLTAKLALVQRQTTEDISRALRHNGGLLEFPIEQVVVTESVRRWWAFRALELFYRDVYFSQLNDRYGERWHTYETLAQESERQLWRGGLGRNLSPLPRPAAPTVTTGPGTIPAGTYFLASAWVNRRGEESLASEPVTVAVDALFGWTLDAGTPPPEASGWTVYAGSSADRMIRQNGENIEVSTTWVQAGGLQTSGSMPGAGQIADLYYTSGRRQRRG